MLISSSILRRHDRLVEVDEHVRRAEVAVVLRDLVLEDQVVAEGVPGELRDEAVVLVEIARAWWVKIRSGETVP